MSLVNLDNDPWISEHEACERLAREIMEQLAIRDREQVQTLAYDSLSARIRLRLKQFSTEVKQLNEKLNSGSIVSFMTSDERERRKRQVELLLSKEVQLQEYFNSKASKVHSYGQSEGSRSNLLNKKPKQAVLADLGTTSWGDLNEPTNEDNVDSYKQDTVYDVREQQQHLIKKQDQGLEELSKVISRQKQIAVSINNEVDEQNEILDDISNNMDRVGGRIDHETDMVKVIARKDKTWGYWAVIILLFITILIVSFT